MVPPEELRNQLMEAYLRYRRQDAFELLGVSEDASVEEMEQKYLEFSENYAPGKFKPSGVSELADKARDLFLAGARAFGELIDPDRREALITRRQEMALDRTNRFTRDQLFERPELLDPETHFNEGRALMKSGKHSQAIARLQFAHDWDPQNSLYRAELAYCRYLADPAGQALESIRELREALRIDPGCGLAFFYAGLIHGEIGNYIEAEVYLHKAAALLRSDTRPTEALESLEIAKERGRKSRPS